MNYKRHLSLGALGLLTLGLVASPAASAKPSKKTQCVTSTLDANGNQLSGNGPVLGRNPDLSDDTLSVNLLQANAPCPTAVYTIGYTDSSNVAHTQSFTNVPVCSATQTSECASQTQAGFWSITLTYPAAIPTASLTLDQTDSANPCATNPTPPPPYYQTTASESVTDNSTLGTTSGSKTVTDDPCSPGSGWF